MKKKETRNEIDKFLNKIFENEYKINIPHNEIIKKLLDNMGCKNSSELIKYLINFYDEDLRNISRKFNNYFYSIVLLDISKNINNEKGISKESIDMFFNGNKININERCFNKKKTILMCILENKYTEMANIIVESQKNYLDRNLKDEDNKSYLMYSVDSGDKEIFDFFLNGMTTDEINSFDNYKGTALTYASKNNNEYMVEELIKNKIYVDTQDILSNSPILYACENDNLKLVKLLLENGGYPLDLGSVMTYLYHKNDLKTIEDIIQENYFHSAYYVDRDEKTTLMYACENGNMELVNHSLYAYNRHVVDKINEMTLNEKKELMSVYENNNLESSGDLPNLSCEDFINQPDNNGKTALMYASENGNSEIVKLLLGKGANIEDRDNTRRSSLVYACENANFEVVKLLLEKGGDINDTDGNFSSTLLMLSSKKNNEQLVSFLIDKGININESNFEQKTALMFACENSNLDVAKLLLKKGAITDCKDNHNSNMLMYACKQKNIELLKLIFSKCKNNVDVNEKNNEGITALMFACEYANVEIIDFLIKNGAKTDYKDNRNTNILMYACKQSNIELLKLIFSKCKNNVDINEKNNDGITALMFACEYANVEIIDFLIKNGAETDCKDNRNNNILIYSCKQNNIELLDFILNKYENVYIDEKNYDDKTALTFACENNNYNVIKYLAENGADVNNLDKLNKTPLVYSYKNIKVINLLIYFGADINFKQENGITILMNACENLEVEVVNFLLKLGADVNTTDIYGHDALYYLENTEYKKPNVTENFNQSINNTVDKKINDIRELLRKYGSISAH